MTAPIRSMPRSALRSVLISFARESLPTRDDPDALGDIIAVVMHYEQMAGGLEGNAGALKQELAEIKEQCRIRHDPEEIRKRDLSELSGLLVKYGKDPWVQQIFAAYHRAKLGRGE